MNKKNRTQLAIHGAAFVSKRFSARRVDDSVAFGRNRRVDLRWAMNKIPWWIDCEKGDLILPGLLGIRITHSRETYQPTSIMRWDRGIFNGSDDLRWLWDVWMFASDCTCSKSCYIWLVDVVYVCLRFWKKWSMYVFLDSWRYLSDLDLELFREEGCRRAYEFLVPSFCVAATRTKTRTWLAAQRRWVFGDFFFWQICADLGMVVS